MTQSENKTKYFIGMIVAMLIWGMAWTSGKAAAEHSNAEVAAFWRYAISFITVIPIIFYMKTSFKADKLGVFYMVLAGALIAFFNYLFFAGLSHGQAGYGGTLVTAISPILTYLMSLTIFKTQITTKQILALSVGIFGAIILLKIPFEGLGFLNVDSSYFLECAVVWSIVTIIAQKAAQRGVDPMFYTLVVFGVTGLINMFFALPFHPFVLNNFDSIFWWNILFIGIFAGTFSTALFFISASKIGAHQTGVFMFIVPVGAIISSWIIYGEEIMLSTIVGCALSFVAVLLFNSRRGLRKKAQII
ncbi:EamA family transporter [Halarcobacter mediterraneus]|uniref:EamA family transporter n=1 Tax=Halarcobacter mediterraneus TaxID=2023153 RepID=A0A4Q1B2A7_9BACT|nr:DMT family transporter [Halarcobacter mediterraneus]RXK14491.1 EamA family transporter [Halarcobacter mediterraneus]